MNLFSELRRRNVVRVGAAYLVTAWLLIQIAGAIFPLFGYGNAPARVIVIILAIGFVPSLIFAWVFELTPEGLRLEKDVDRSQSIAPRTGKLLDRLIIVVLTLSLGYFAFDKFVLSPRREELLARQTSEAVAAAREEGRVAGQIGSYGDRSIVVLPFLNMSSDPEQDYFSDGITEELLNLLARIPELRVTSRVSAFSFKKQTLPVTEIAARLHVAHVLEGSVRRSGERVRITAQLIDARSDTHLWSETWDRTIDDVFAVQDEIAGAVAERLKVTILSNVPKVKATNPSAYALYLQARQLGRRLTPSTIDQAIALFQEVLAIDPTYAPAWNGLGSIYANQANQGMRPIDEGFRLAREASTRAIALDPEYAPAHANLGWIARAYDRELAISAEHYEHALKLEPGNVGTIGGAAILAQSLDRLDIAAALNEYAVARDPVNPTSYFNLASTYHSAGRSDDAIAALHTVLRLSPGHISAQQHIGVELMLEGDAESGLAAVQQESDEAWRLIGLSMIYHALGRAADSDAAVTELIEKYEQDSAYNIAYVCAVRDEPDRVFDWLERALKYNDPGLPATATEPLFRNVRDDPRWLPFLRKIGKAPEQLAAIHFDVTLPRNEPPDTRPD